MLTKIFRWLAVPQGLARDDGENDLTWLLWSCM